MAHHFGRHFGIFKNKVKYKLPTQHDSAIYPADLKVSPHKNPHSNVTAAFFIISKNRKPPRYPSGNRYTHRGTFRTVGHYSEIKGTSY